MIEKKDGEALLIFLEKRCPSYASANVEIIIESATYKKVGTGREEYNFHGKIYNRIDNFDKSGFDIIALGYSLTIPYEYLDCWIPDEWGDKENPNKIHLYLNKALVLHEREKIALEDL